MCVKALGKNCPPVSVAVGLSMTRRKRYWKSESDVSSQSREMEEKKRAHLVHEPKEGEREERETADERSDDRVSESDDGEERHRRPESTPGDGGKVVLDVVDRARSRTEEDELDVVDDELGDLKERTSGTGERGRNLWRKGQYP